MCAWPVKTNHVPLAERYRAVRASAGGGLVREVGGPVEAFPWTERHLRCAWADARWRPAELVTADRQRVVVEECGRWNLEAGPDFLDAVLRVEPGARVVRGDVELHIRPQDWTHHGHAGDPRYQRVVAHVTYFPGVLGQGCLPPGTMEIALGEALRRNPFFSFEAMDVRAFPYAEADRQPPCSVELASWDPEKREGLLDAAGAERIRVKAARLRCEMAVRSPAQVLYEELMGGLGFKHNRLPFRMLASRLPLEALRRGAAEGGVLGAYALLCGVSGLLPDRVMPRWDAEARGFIRAVWDLWWKRKDGWDEMVLGKGEWRLSNLRPVNHPLRRMMAAAELFCGDFVLEDALRAASMEGAPWVERMMRDLCGIGGNGFWTRRTALAAVPSDAPVALIGPGRAAALIVNALVPWIAACGDDPEWPDAGFLRALPAEDDNRSIRHMAHALFGHDHNPALYRTGLRQQGLLQIFGDFCLNARGGCRTCRFPGALAHQKW